MQVKNKIFPYPMLNNNGILSGFNNSEFLFLFETQETDDEYILKNARFKTNSNLIQKMYDEDKISVICVVECSNTIYRKSFPIGYTEGTNIVLSKNDFTEKVIISVFAYANHDMILDSEEFDEDYKNEIYEIEKYDIVCANDGFNVYFIHNDEEDNITHSIFSIIIDHSINDGAYKVEYNASKKINIYVSDEDYKNYKLIYAVPAYKEVFFNMLLIPVLSEAFTKCIEKAKSDANLDIEDIGNEFMWFRAVQNGYKRIKGEELTRDKLVTISPILLAQEILGKPFGIALTSLIKETQNFNVKEDE